MNKEINHLTDTPVRQFHMPRYQDLPNMGLYLEQATKYLNGLLAPLGCLEITSSMISNYVKKGLIPNPVRKQYYAEHLAYLFFVAVAKQLASMEDITLLIQAQQASYPLAIAYDYFCDELENSVFFIFGLKETLDSYGSTVSEEKDLLRNLVFLAAHMIYMHARFELLREKRGEGPHNTAST